MDDKNICYGRIENLDALLQARTKKVAIADERSNAITKHACRPRKKLLRALRDAQGLDMPVLVQPRSKRPPLYFGSQPYSVQSFEEDEDEITVQFAESQNKAVVPKHATPNVDAIRQKLMLSRDRGIVFWVPLIGFGIGQRPRIVDILHEVDGPKCCVGTPHHAQYDAESHRPVSVSGVQKLFKKIRRLSTRRRKGRLRGIPFRYVADGCQYRCHAMCRELLSLGVWPMKAWAFATKRTFRFPTKDHVNCEARWQFHCAAVVQTTDGLYVIDPSTQDYAVPVSSWYAELRNNGAKLYITSHHVFRTTIDLCRFESDPEYKVTEHRLRVHRINLRLQSLLFGVPPCQKKDPPKS